MNDRTNAEHFPWLDNRKNANTKPVYKIIARCMSLTGDSIVMLHRAGNDYVENYYIRELVKNTSIMADLDKKEADLLKWVINSETTDPLKK